jgi:ABC-2 type transport system permease protein
MNTMTMKWLLRREFWEHRGSMFWAPAVVAALLVVLVGGTMIYGLAAHGAPGFVHVNGQVMSHGAFAAAMPGETRAMLSRVASGMYLAAGAPLFLILTGVVFFYCLGALYDERRDRSILFWKSLPVSDQMTVLSKVITAACVAPVITIATAVALSVSMLLLGCIGMAVGGINVFGAVLSSAQLYLSPLAVVSLLPVYVLWALPTIGWLLLVSSWAKSKVFLWATGVPLVTLAIAKWISYLMVVVFNSGDNLLWIVRDVVARLLTGLFPGIWFAYKDIDPTTLAVAGHKSVDIGSIVAQSWMTLASVDAWIGVIGGVAMIVAAIRVRRWRDEG